MHADISVLNYYGFWKWFNRWIYFHIFGLIYFRVNHCTLHFSAYISWMPMSFPDLHMHDSSGTVTPSCHHRWHVKSVSENPCRRRRAYRSTLAGVPGCLLSCAPSSVRHHARGRKASSVPACFCSTCHQIVIPVIGHSTWEDGWCQRLCTEHQSTSCMHGLGAIYGTDGVYKLFF